MLFDKVICFDHFLQKIFLIVNMTLSEGEAGYKRAVLELENMHRLLKSGEQKKEEPGRCLSDFRLLHSKEEYMQMVKKAKRHFEGWRHFSKSSFPTGWKRTMREVFWKVIGTFVA